MVKTLRKVAVFGILAASVSMAFAEASAGGDADKWSPVGFGIGIPDFSARPHFRVNSLLWPDSDTEVCGLDLTALCGFRKGVDGVQIGGLVASTDTMNGLCFGCADFVFEDFRGVMIGGYGSIANKYGEGAMFAGGFSFAREFYGAQISGAFNWAGSGNVFQVGCINYAGSAKCLQIGVLNFGSEGLCCSPIIRAHW